MSQPTPTNGEGQQPTRSSRETVARLEEKKRGSGTANQERIERQEQEIEPTP